MSSAICFNLDHYKILLSGNGLNNIQSINNPTLSKNFCSFVPIPRYHPWKCDSSFIFSLNNITACRCQLWAVVAFHLKPLLKQQILNFSKLREFEADDFNFDGNGRKVSKAVENTLGKGEIACYEQFLLFLQYF